MAHCLAPPCAVPCPPALPPAHEPCCRRLTSRRGATPHLRSAVRTDLQTPVSHERRSAQRDGQSCSTLGSSGGAAEDGARGRRSAAALAWPRRRAWPRLSRSLAGDGRLRASPERARRGPSQAHGVAHLREPGCEARQSCITNTKFLRAEELRSPRLPLLRTALVVRLWRVQGQTEYRDYRPTGPGGGAVADPRPSTPPARDARRDATPPRHRTRQRLVT